MSDWASDFWTDEAFPNRPDHADFWRLSEIILQLNALPEDGSPFDLNGEIEQDADPESVEYMATNRARRTLVTLAQHKPNPSPEDLVSLFAGSWIEGFLAGSRFEKRGGRR